MANSPTPLTYDVFTDFVDLNRTFHELSRSGRESDDFDTARAFQVGDRITWAKLLEHYRVVILSEAGSGKTREIQHATQMLRMQGIAAFFLRLENIGRSFNDAFSEGLGTYEEFEDWRASGREGWLLLDSVDEARLRDPGDFALAIREIGRLVNAAKDRTHVIITGRTSAWRAKTDLETCVKALPPPTEVTRERVSLISEFDSDSEELAQKATEDTESTPTFLVVSLDDLNKTQVEIFARAKGITDTQAFIAAIDRADAFSFTTRPEDLSELIQFWIDNGRIGGRLEMLQNSIDRRLEERDQSRRDYRPLAAARVREGIKLLAAATTLTGIQAIRVPDGSYNCLGLNIRQILPEWDDKDQLTLLSRPIFDEAIYGTVRFHHRSVREYLTAEWFAELLARQTSRRAIEGLFFREQYGMEIVVPALRPVLPWLALLDGKICDRVRKIAPEIFFEGGDPARLPVDIRRHVLLEVCEQMAIGNSERIVHNYAAAQRFANQDISEDIAYLLLKYVNNDVLQAFLLKMIWLGELSSLRSIVLEKALAPEAEKYVRISAFRALAAVGSKDDLATVRQCFLDEAVELDRDWFAELLKLSTPSADVMHWMLASLRKLAPERPHTFDYAPNYVADCVLAVDISLLPEITEGLSQLLQMPPVIERRHCEVSKKNQWLLVAAGKAVARLIQQRHFAALSLASLTILRSIGAGLGYDIHDLKDAKADLQTGVGAWAELRRALIWFEINASRQSLDERKGERLTEHWQSSLWCSFGTFGSDDFEYFLEQMDQQQGDNRLVALSIAFSIYRSAGRAAGWREKLKRRATGDPVLEEYLQRYLHPPAQSVERRRSKQSEARWKRESERRQKSEATYHENWKSFLANKLGEIKSSQERSPGLLSQAMLYLFQETQDENKINHRWTEYNWKSLIERFGAPVATFYRDTAVRHWRYFRPQLRSEGHPAGTTATATIIGLAGLEIEAIESEGRWLSDISEQEVIQACRFASFELNGFPLWFPALFNAFPNVVSAFLMQEIKYELSTETTATDSNYILSDVSWSAQWAWDDLGPAILQLLKEREPLNVENLNKLLKILLGSTVSDSAIAELAITKCQSVSELNNLALWFAVWCGLQPGPAIEMLKAKLDRVDSAEMRLELVMRFLNSLWGGRRDESVNARGAYREPEYLKALYLLVHKYIRMEDDIERAGTGLYSPGLRDHAQEARNALLSALTEIPGKRAFLALMEISQLHPDATMRPRILHYAKRKAEQDGDLVAWKAEQVYSFAHKIERTPSNHRDLAELVHLRFLDLKDDLENGDSSVASLLMRKEETEVRKYLGHEMREKANGRYSVSQEEQLADDKRPDLRFMGMGFDGPVPVELKLAGKWTGPQLFERLERQLCGDYLRDNRSNRGLFVLIYADGKGWRVPGSESIVDFTGLVQALAEHWRAISSHFPNVEDVYVVGIDLTRRAR